MAEYTEDFDQKKNSNYLCKITEQTISVDDVIKSTKDPSCGATALFIGTVRNHNAGRQVKKIYYESYVAMAEKRMRKILSDINHRWPQVRKLSIVHRIGELVVGEISVLVCASAPHRAEAFEACRYAIDMLKQSVPIWKKETFADNTESWTDGIQVSFDE